MAARDKFPERRRARQEQAAARAAARAERSDLQQLERLDAGKFIAFRERNRLLVSIHQGTVKA